MIETEHDAPEHPYRITIPEVRPNLGCGRYPVKRVVGEILRVTADVIKDGNDTLCAEVRYRPVGGEAWDSAPMAYSYEDDEWSGEAPLQAIGEWEYTVAAWSDGWASWIDEVRRKLGAGRTVASELLEGAALVRAAADRADGADRDALAGYAAGIAAAPDHDAALAAAGADELAALMRRHQLVEDLTEHGRRLSVIVMRERARFGAWYELFPRSEGGLRGGEARLPAIKAMGFDIAYLAPIHPIGVTNRKGKNNTLAAEPGDPGSPWAIGNEHGGHDAVDPEIGTLEDFAHFVRAARDVDLEVALDLAIQCSPDHPYVREHPQWFRKRPDGTIKYAENPPKRYEDIVALDLWCDDYRALWEELRRVVLFWIERGVTLFRVDNPHTKPLAFWEWLLREVRREHPDVVLLSEAFTRPKRLKELARIGFHQSYTYFTWKNARWELEQFMAELLADDAPQYLQPNFFTNTQDILHEYLQLGGRPAFKVRHALAATLSPTYGVYSGFELCENTPLRPGSEEYLNSEKYELRPRDWDQPGNLSGYIGHINRLRRENRALQRGYWDGGGLVGPPLRFHDPDNQAIIAYSRVSEDWTNRILVVANLDPFSAQGATVYLDGGALGLDGGSGYTVHDLITGNRYGWWGLANYVRLDPHEEPVHVFRIE